MSVAEDSPSAERRKALKEADAANQLRVLGSCPLSKYFDIADRLLIHFHDAVDGRRLDEAYVFGLRFANLCLSSLPQHPEWTHSTSSKGRKRLTSEVGDVLGTMNVIKQRMDAEELMLIKEEMLAKQAEEARKKEAEDRRKNQLDEESRREQKIRDALEEERAQFLAEQRSQRQEEMKQMQEIAKKKQKESKKKQAIEKPKQEEKKKKQAIEKQNQKTLKKQDIEKSAMAKLKAMQAKMSPLSENEAQGQGTVADTKSQAKPSKSAKAKGKESSQKIADSKSQSKPSKTSKAKGKGSAKKIADTETQTKPSKSSKVKGKESAQKIADTETQTKPSESSKVKGNESTQKKSFGWGKQKSNAKSKEENATLPSKSLTQPLIVKDIKDSTTASLAAPAKEKEVISTKKTPKSTERKSSTKENNEKTRIIPTSVGKKENNLESEMDEKKTMIEADQDEEIEPSQDTISTKSDTKIVKKDSDSTRSVTSKKRTPISFIKSKIQSAKSSIATIPSSKLLPSAKRVDDSVNNTPASVIAPQQTPKSRKEKATIDNLKRAISMQEDRLEYIEEKQIPSLLQAAKSFLTEDNKKEALKCLAHKKRLERQADTIKSAVFNMETQMFMLESAFEDRHVKNALDEAATAIAGLQQNIGDPNAAVLDLQNMSASLPELDVGDSSDEELMEELEQWLSPEETRKSQEDASDIDMSLLSMPAFLVPAAPVAVPVSSSVDRIANPLIA